MNKTVHMCIDVRGVLGWPDRELNGFLVNAETGKNLTAAEAREALYAELLQGHAVIPMGEPCEGFDYSGGGCPGHPVPEEATGAPQ
jgi:hypothetical protein